MCVYIRGVLWESKQEDVLQQVSSWSRKFDEPKSSEAQPLLVFPHAGSGASAYRGMSAAFSEHFDVTVLQYPGRQDRMSEPLPSSVEEIAEGALADLLAHPITDRPLTVFGHSMGAAVAFEFVRRAEVAGMSISLLMVSAAVAPSRAAGKPSHPTDDEEILAHLKSLEGTDSGVFGDADLMRMALPVIKGDYRAFDAYTSDESATISAPIAVIGGDSDPIVSIPDLYAWNRHSPKCQVTVFAGGHFFLYSAAEEVSRLLADSALEVGRV